MFVFKFYLRFQKETKNDFDHCKENVNIYVFLLRQYVFRLRFLYSFYVNTFSIYVYKFYQG
jgi:hypothetical protein